MSTCRAAGQYFATRVKKPEDAQELVQMTLFKMHMARERFDEAASFKTWAFTIASRTLIDFYRSQKRNSPEIDLQGNEQFTVAELREFGEDDESEHEKEHSLKQALEKLKPNESELVLLYAEEDLGLREVAARMGLTVGAVKTRLHRVYKTIRRLMSAA